ncbi:MAG TPA: hypothetical protein VF077_00550 [Nitrospiraceae bacterium]
MTSHIDCYHKNLDDNGFCLDCGVRAAIQIDEHNQLLETQATQMNTTIRLVTYTSPALNGRVLTDAPVCVMCLATMPPSVTLIGVSANTPEADARCINCNADALEADQALDRAMDYAMARMAK